VKGSYDGKNAQRADSETGDCVFAVADGGQMHLHWHATYTAFRDDVDFSAIPTIDRPVSDQWEFGAAIRRRDSPISIWFLNFDMLGLGFRLSSSGNLKGITFVFRSVFDE